MTAIRVQYVPLSELSLERHAAFEWLSPLERQAWQAMRSPHRQATWLAGRIVAKQLLALRQTQPTALHIETRSLRPGHGERPQVFAAGHVLPCALSIAHTSRGVLVAGSQEPGIRLGVDLVGDVPPAGRLNWAFTAAERAWLSATADADQSVARLWAMKEALYKACHSGEGFAPGRIEVVPGGTAHYGDLKPHEAIRDLQSWRVDGHYAALAVVAGETAQPAAVHTVAHAA